MYFSAADTRELVADLGDPASWTPPSGSAQAGHALYDAPDEALFDGQVYAQSAVVRYPAGQWVGLTEGQTITVGARSLRLTGVPRALDDGGLMSVPVRAA